MEREVFEDIAIAALMNRYFINIKVDREEHPQLDELYMTARQLMTHEGGWPNNIFLNHDLKPFHAGGTYGAQDAYGKPSFPRLIEWLHDNWENKREEVEAMANEAGEVMQRFLSPQTAPLSGDDFSGIIAELRAKLAQHFDAESGGFYQAPKFPQENFLQFLIHHHEQTGDEESLDMAAFSLGKMATGGIYDHVGCGFHRYAVDKDWLVPHFEKMLYTQAQLTRCYADLARITESPYFADITRSVCEFVAGPFTDGGGAFYSAIDAETDAVEGAYYAWTKEDIESLLTPDELAFFTHHYGLAEIPRFEGHKHPDGDVIIGRMPLPEAALQRNLPYEQVAGMAGQVLNKLLAVRNLRISPSRDEKIIVSWNGLMIDAMAYAGKVLDEPSYIARARKAVDYILKHGINNDGQLMRCITAGRAQHLATLDDYAYFIKGLLSLHDASGDNTILQTAKTLMARAEELFGDKKGVGFYLTQENDNAFIRIKNGDDNALPSANAVMAENYMKLGERHKALTILQTFLADENSQWLEYSSMLTAALQFKKPEQVTVKPIERPLPERFVRTKLSLFPKNARAGENAQLILKLDIADGFHISAMQKDGREPVQVALQSGLVELLDIERPIASTLSTAQGDIICYHGQVGFVMNIKLLDSYKQPEDLAIRLTYQPCNENSCFEQVNELITLKPFDRPHENS